MQKLTQGMVIWLVVALFDIYATCLNGASSVFIEPLKNTFHVSDFGVSIAIGAFILGFACMQIPVGYLLDKYNAKYVVSSGVLLLALGNILVSYATNLLFFSLANLLEGIGASFAFIAVGIIISQWFPDKLFPVLFGFSQTFSCVLIGIVHYYLNTAIMVHSWSEIYRILAACGFGLFVLTLLLVKSPPKNVKIVALTLKESLRIVLSNRQIWLCTVAVMTAFGPLLAYATFWYVNIQKYYAVKTIDEVIISGLIFVGIALGTPIWGWVSNHFKSRKMVIHVSLCLGTMGLLMCLYLPHYQLDTLVLIKIISLCTGFLLSGSMLFYTVVSEISFSNTRGVALSVANTGVYLFNSILMVIPYLLITPVSTLFFTYLWVLPFCIIISVLLNYFIHETYEVNYL